MLNVNSLRNKVHLVHALVASIPRDINEILLTEHRLAPGSVLALEQDFPGFEVFRVDGRRKGQGGVLALVREELMCHEYTVDAPLGPGMRSGDSVLWIRYPHLRPPRQRGIVYYSPTRSTMATAAAFLSVLDAGVAAAQGDGYAWSIVGDLNAAGLLAALGTRSLADGERETPLTRPLAAWLGLPRILGTVVSCDTWTRFGADGSRSQLDYEICDAATERLLVGCTTENGGGLLRAPIMVSDHRALVAVYRYGMVLAGDDDGNETWEPAPTRKLAWARAATEPRRLETYLDAFMQRGAPLLAGLRRGGVEALAGGNSAARAVKEVIAAIARAEDLAGIARRARAGASSGAKPRPPFLGDARIAALFAHAAERQLEVERAYDCGHGTDAAEIALRDARDAADAALRDAEAVRIFDATLDAQPGDSVAAAVPRLIRTRVLGRRDRRARRQRWRCVHDPEAATDDSDDPDEGVVYGYASCG